MLNSYSSGEGVYWVANSGGYFKNMTWRLGDLLTKTNDCKKPSEVGQGLDDEDRLLRMMDK